MFLATVEEEGDVGVFFGFRAMELLVARLANDFAQGDAGAFGREANRREKARVVLSQRGDDKRIKLEAIKAGKGLLSERFGELAWAVVAEVEKNHAVIFLRALVGGKDHRQDEFVVDPGIVAGLNGFAGAAGFLSFAMRD